MDTLEFLQTIYVEADRGHSQLFSLPSATAAPIDINNITVPGMPDGEDIYFSVGLSAGPKAAKLSTPDIIGIPGLWVDIDIAHPVAHAKKNLPADVQQAMSILPDDIQPSIIVHSGYGLHCYYLFREFWYFDTPEESEQAGALLIRLQAYVRAQAQQHGWHMDATTDICRVLRLPGTFNVKVAGNPVQAMVIESCDARYNPADIAEMVPEVDITTGQRIRKTNFERRPTDGPAAPMLTNCNFMVHAQLNAKTLSYQEWLAALTNLVRATDGVEAAHQISALDTARYNPKQTDRKIDECLSAMHPQGCEYIRRELGFQGCPEGGCDVNAPCAWSLAKVPQARALVRSISVPTPEVVYSPAVAKLRELELAAAQKSVPLWVKIAVVVLVIALMSAAAVAGYHWLKHEQAVVMSQQQIQQAAELAKALDISKSQATKLTAELAKVKDKPPEIQYIVQAQTVEKAAEQVKKDIDAGKSPANKIPADKTVVTPNTKDQKVDVYRITLDKAKWGVSGLVLAGGTEAAEFGAGISYHNKDWSASAGVTTRSRVFVMGTKYF